MAPEEMETRLRYLEKVVDKILPHTVSAKNKKVTSETAPATPEPSPVVSAADMPVATGTIRLVLPRYRVPYGDDLVMVDAVMLKSNPGLLAYMRQHHPTCFIN